jgi:hypothetical protein
VAPELAAVERRDACGSAGHDEGGLVVAMLKG